MKNKSILLTGYTGFVGSHLLTKLCEDNYQIFCLGKKSPECNSKKIEFIYQDFREELSLEMLPQNLDCIIHLAATMDKNHTNKDIFQINTISTLNLLDYGLKAGIKKFIYSSSGGIYGYSRKKITEKSPANPIDFYGVSKYSSELLINRYSKHFNVNILRIFYPYGPNQKKGIIPLLFNRINSGDPITIYNKNNPKINPIFIEDLVKIIEKILPLDQNLIVNVGGDDIVNIKEIALTIGNIVGNKPNFIFMSNPEIVDMYADNSKIKKILNIEHFTSFKKNLFLMAK